MDDVRRPLLNEEPMDRMLIEQIKLLPGSKDDLVVTSRSQRTHDRATDKTAMSRYEDRGVFDHTVRP